MVDSFSSSRAHQELLTLKENILAQWARLPPEHQATMLLVFLERVKSNEYGPWAAYAIKLLSTPHETPPTPEFAPPISHEDLAHHTSFTSDEIEHLSTEDLRDISAAVTQHLVYDVFWDEVEYMAHQRLDQTH